MKMAVVWEEGSQGPTGESVAATRWHLRRPMRIDGAQRCGVSPSGACPDPLANASRSRSLYYYHIMFFYHLPGLQSLLSLAFNNILQPRRRPWWVVGWGREYVT
jgi:hypothetical protein